MGDDRIKRQELEERRCYSQKMKAVGQLTEVWRMTLTTKLAVIIGSLELVEPDARDAPRSSVALEGGGAWALRTQRPLAFSRKAGAASPGGRRWRRYWRTSADASLPAGDLKPGD